MEVKQLLSTLLPSNDGSLRLSVLGTGSVTAATGAILECTSGDAVEGIPEKDLSSIDVERGLLGGGGGMSDMDGVLSRNRRCFFGIGD